MQKLHVLIVCVLIILYSKRNDNYIDILESIKVQSHANLKLPLSSLCPSVT